jgi:hypothetical protein
MARRVVAQQEVETTQGWLYPSNFQNLQKAAEVRNATMQGRGLLPLNYWRPQMLLHFSQQVIGTGHLYEGAF